MSAATGPAGALVAAIEEAAVRLDGHIRQTPVEISSWLSAATGAEVFLKLENYQSTGSFKLRGALNRVFATDPAARQRGFVAASTGNHGLAVAHAAAVVGATVTVFVPRTAEPAKVELLEERGVGLERAGEDCIQAEAAARAFAERQGATYVSPYNDPAVVAGQGTLGRELGRQVEGLDAVFVALGGGGLVSGVAAALKSTRPALEVVGCSPCNSAVMAHSLASGRLLELPSEPTLSDGTAGGVEAGSITFEFCRRLVDRCALVTEEAIAAALIEVLDQHHALIEGAAAVPVAALLATGRSYAGRRVAVVLCGANIGRPTLARLLAQATAG